MEKLGTLLKSIRHDQHQTQKSVASGICSQSMLSAIENNEYLPNAAIFIQLAKRLNIDLNQIGLANNFDISSQKNFNDTLSKLCGEHKYQQLLDFLQQDEVIDQLEEGTQTQAYYYYLAVAQMQTGHTDDAFTSGKLSIAEANDREPSTLTRLAYISLAYAHATQHKGKLARANQDLAFNNLEKLKYDEDQNILFYLAALIDYELQDYEGSANKLKDGIKFITSHNSHYMLANSYYLLSLIAEKLNNDVEKIEASKRSNLFTDLYEENVFEDI
ncbi:helix-turn-helix domain-containing protein [Companilactobacillus ginsenosidimutans]|uniref:helix-turn-helix domain-containing protein n=1 Tax=Companilactobacillus ginsenosidimutans TaxID=1007676 RepID=UPI000660F2D4|nr:helix-turn-helix transcriptional regulator [Companilactobacillus ginsenosidimutans]